MLFEDLGNSQTLKDKVYLNLRELIITGKIQPGDRLPEDDLSRQMNISRAPIREALNMLEREGFVTIIPRKGAIVSEVSPDMIADVWEMRSLLESYAAKASAKLIPEEAIDAIEKMVREAEANPENSDLYIKSDLELHEMLHKYKNNRYLSDFIATTASHSLRVRYCVEYSDMFSGNVVREVCEEHMAILEALRERKPVQVQNAVLTHIRNSQQRCKSMLPVSGAEK